MSGVKKSQSMSELPDHSFRVSVVVPTFNGEAYILALLESMQEQTRPPDEIIISDDQSEDSTLEVVEKFSRNSSVCVQVLSHTRQGITKNYLHALSHATGDFILFADQDDAWVPTRVERYLNEFASFPDASVVSSDSQFADEQLQPLAGTLRGGEAASRALVEKVNRQGDLSVFLKIGLPIAAHSLAIRSSCKEMLLQKPEDVEDWWFEDWVVTVCLLLGHMRLIPDALTNYRRHADQFTQAREDRTVGVPSVQRKKRAAQLRYSEMLCARCASVTLLAAEESTARFALIKRAADFFEGRLALVALPFFQRVVAVGRLFLKGDYGSFSRGFYSAAKDIILPQTNVKRSPSG